MDLLATSPSFLLVDPIARSYREFVLLYKEAQKLKFIPPPTIKCKVLTNVLKEINGHEPRQTRIMENTPIENTTEKTNSATPPPMRNPYLNKTIIPISDATLLQPPAHPLPQPMIPIGSPSPPMCLQNVVPHIRVI